MTLVDIINIINWFILWYFIIFSSAYVILLLFSIPDIFFSFEEARIGDIGSSLTKSYSMPPVTVVISAYNEEQNILESIYSILKSVYPNLFIIVINDGSEDKTLQKLITAFDLRSVAPIVSPKIKTIGKIVGYYISETQKRIIVIDKEHTDKSDSLNVGLNTCRTPLFVTVDADTLLEPLAISRIVYYTLTHAHAVAVGGAVYILNGCTYKQGEILEKKMPLNLLRAFQACEYLRSFLFSRSGWNALGGALCYAGAFTLFDYMAVLDAKGFEVGNPALDFEIIAHLQEKKLKHPSYKIRYTPAAISWTDVPGTISSYWHQRYNWQIGILQSLMAHKNMFFNPNYGIVGLFTVPFYFLGEAFSAIVEFTAYLSVLLSWYLGILDPHWTLLFIVICWGFSTFLTMATSMMSFVTFNRYQRLKDLLWILFLVVIENFGFRQIHVLCRVLATVQFFGGKLKFWNWYKKA